VTARPLPADGETEPIEDEVLRLIGERALVLVGIMGAGKTSIGKRLAQRLRLPFVDADHEIETAANQTIAEIFETHGEAYFRDGESRVIQRLLGPPAKVLATGGGAFMAAGTREAIKEKAISIWLNADLEVLMARVRRRNNRPLLRQGDPETVMRKLMAERNPIYAEAAIHIRSREVAHETVVDEIMTALADHLGREEAARP
jgi:shikimate kinase